MGELRAGDRMGERYVLIERLGIGGMGEVWLAWMEGDRAFRRRVVVKVLAPERRDDERIARMLADEARVAGLIHHPGIISALDYLETDDGPLFILEYVDGTSLRTALKLARRKNLIMPEALASHVCAQVARALHGAHRARNIDGTPLKLVHRDVSPDNVLLSRQGAVYLGDFGVARAAGNLELTQPGAGPKGKIGYMAPEQARMEPVGPTADIFSLGRVAAEAADVGAGPALRAVIEKATAERPEDRYQTAAELAAALIRACPPPADADGELSEWLALAAPEALAPRQTSAGAAATEAARPASRPPRPLAPRMAPAALFAGIEEQKPRPVRLRFLALLGAVLALSLPVSWILAAAASGRSMRLFQREAGVHAPHGELRVRSAPPGADVYVDGRKLGQTPMALQLPVGSHVLRVGNPRLERWRSDTVNLREDAVQVREIDLTE